MSNEGQVAERSQKQSSIEIGFVNDVPQHLRPLLTGELRALSLLADRKAIDLSTNDLDRDNPIEAGQWDEERQLRGLFLTWLITESTACNDLPARRLRIIGARVNGVLDLSFRRVNAYLYFSQSSVSSGIRLTSTRLVGLEFSQVRCGPISGWASVSEGAFIFELARISGQLNFPNSKISGDFILRNSTVDADGGLAVNAANIIVEGNLSFLNSRVLGNLALFNANIKGLFEIDGGQISSSFSSAIAADGINIAGRCLVRNGVEIKGSVRLANAKIGGEFNLSGTKISQEGDFALDGRNARVGGALILVNGFNAVGKVAFYGVEIGGECNFAGARITSSGDASLDLRTVTIKAGLNLGAGFFATSAVLLYNASINGDLIFSGAHLSAVKGFALDARRCKVEGSVFFVDGFFANAELSFYGALIGELFFARAVLQATNTALQLNNAKLVRLVMDDTKVEGSVKLSGAQVESEVAIVRSKITSINDCTLEAANLHAGSLFIRDGTIVEGMIRLYGAEFSGDVVLNDCYFKKNGKSRETIFDAPTMHSEGTLHWYLAMPPDGVVNLEQAHVHGLSDNIDSWPQRVRLDGFTYSRILGDAPKAVNTRLSWLGRQDRYFSQPFEHLISIYRSMGDSNGVAETALSKWRTRRREMPQWNLLRPWRLSRAWDVFLDLSSGYGYRPWRSLLALMFVFLLGSGVFWWGEKRNVFCAVETLRTDKPCSLPPQYPKFNPLIYSFETMLPIGEFGQRRLYVIRGDLQVGEYVGVYVGLHRFLGLVFSLLLALAPTNILRRE